MRKASEFSSDGCSWWPDGDYYSCCYTHDIAYFWGGDWRMRLEADRELRECVRKTSRYGALMAWIMFIGVRIGGSSAWPFHFRWGYGLRGGLQPPPGRPD